MDPSSGPPLSIVIRSLDTADTLPRVLAALGRRPDDQLIVVDSGSTDGSLEHARAAGIVGGATGGTSSSSLGGTLGVTSNVLRPNSPAGARGQFVVCASGVPGSIAVQIDTSMDEGTGNTGYVFASTQAGLPIVAATGNATYALTATYTQCFQS